MSYLVSPSSLDSFEEDGVCKKNWFFKQVEKKIPRDPPSEQMVKGLLFETLAIGENVSGSEVPDHGFLYKKDGSKTIELERIESQAEKFKRMTDRGSDEYVGFTVRSTQLRLETDKLKGVLDLIGDDEFSRTNIVDLKFTGDVDNTRGKYAWGRDPDEIDWKQLAIYKTLYMANFEGEKSPRTGNIVFDASPRMGIKFFDVKLSDNYINNVIERTDVVSDFVDRVRGGDIDIDTRVSPSKSNCESCPLDCEFRFKESHVKKIKVYV